MSRSVKIDTEDLRKELETRCLDYDHPLRRIADAFKLGHQERVLEMTREYVREQLGVIL